MNMGNNTQTNPPYPDPRVERLAADLQANWYQYLALKDAAEKIAQRQTMPEELIRSLHETANRRLNENIAQSVKTFVEANPHQPGTGAAGTQQGYQRTASVKKLCRTDYDKMLAGVCGGVGEYLNMDSSIVRLMFVLFGIFYGMGVIAYIVLTILLPIKMTPNEVV